MRLAWRKTDLAGAFSWMSGRTIDRPMNEGDEWPPEADSYRGCEGIVFDSGDVLATETPRGVMGSMASTPPYFWIGEPVPDCPLSLPLEARNDGICDANGNYVVDAYDSAFSPREDRSHMRQIARAVNMHDSLVESCKKGLEELSECRSRLIQLRQPAYVESNLNKTIESMQDTLAMLNESTREE